MSINAQPRSAQACHRVLIVDDMEANRSMLCRRLELFGYQVSSVDSGAAALARIAADPPDIVLLDYMMPQMNGIEVLCELRQNPATRDLPVVMVTARAESEATIEALEAGADDYVTKPIDFDVLRARVETHIAKHDSAKHLERANAALDQRVALRSMALADLETELQEEIVRRQELERRIESTSTDGVELAATLEPTPTLGPAITVIRDKFEVIFAGATTGRPINFAQLAELRLLINELFAQA